MTKFLIMPLWILLSQSVDAKPRCELIAGQAENANQNWVWQWQDKHLRCSLPNAETTRQGFDMANLLIIRGHGKNINTDKYQIIHRAHGYHLVLNLGHNNEQSHSHNHHLDFIPLTDFKGIKKASPSLKKPALRNVQNLVNQVDASRWRDDVTTLSSWSRRTGESGNVAAANWIETKLTNLGYQTSQQPFQVGQTPTNNIIGIKPGMTRPDDWYLVGAHMDSVPSGNAPGAVDNASGCAATLEMAQIASVYQFEGTLIFMCFSGEEQGLIGSEYHADSLINGEDDDKIKLALTLDMVGYTSNSDHELLIESSSTYQPLMNEMAQYAATYAPGLTVYTSTNYFGSDHVSYIDNGMPGILSIDDDWNVYPAYHQSNDLPENINLTQGEYIIKTNMATLVEKAVVMGSFDLIFADDFD